MWVILRLASVGAVILFYRYAMKLGTIKGDWWLVVEYSERVWIPLRRGANMVRAWLISWIEYLPTDATKAAWTRLRDRYRGGTFGEQGT